MSTHKELAQIIEAFKPKRFLEIGVQFGGNLLAVDCPYKVGIEPFKDFHENFPHKIYRDTSDNVFADKNFREDAFDMIFIDGLHKFKQVVRDVRNSLRFLTKDGFIICHDVYPFDLLGQYKDLTARECPGAFRPWTGDVWKLILYVKFCMTELNFCTIRNFPGFLCLWHNSTPRNNYVADDILIDINTIDILSVVDGIEHIPDMNVVSVEEFISNAR